MPDTEHAFSKIPTDGLSRDLAGLTRLGENFGAAMSGAFLAAAADGRKLSGVLRSLVQSLGSRALAAALRPLSDAAGNLFGGALGAVLANAKGNVVSAGRIRAFASGGIVNGPTLFPLNSGMGLMGEKGAEAILPLARSSDGKLGVRAGAASSVSVTMNITTSDAESFRRSEQQIAAALARAVERGQRNR